MSKEQKRDYFQVSFTFKVILSLVKIIPSTVTVVRFVRV